MATYLYTIEKLSGSTDGLPIKVTGTSTAATVSVHAAAADADDIDAVTLTAVNNDVIPVVLTLEWGTATAADGNVVVSIPPQSGFILICDREHLMNSKEIKAFASVANKILIKGRINRAKKT